METLFSAVNLVGPAADLKAVGFFGLTVGLIIAGLYLITRIFGIGFGGQDDD